MTLLQAAGVALLIGMVVAFLKDAGGRFALFAAAGGGILLTLWGISRLGGVFTAFRELTSSTVLSPYLTLLMKALGVGYVVEVSADICRDLGAPETAKRLELCGRAELLLLALPPLTELIRLACEMAEGL